MKFIFITGFSHCGTTILRAIIGHMPEVHDVCGEQMLVSDEDLATAHLCGKHAIVFKYPQILSVMPLERYFDMYIDCYVIFLIRNPYYVFSSLNRRKDFKSDEYHSIDKYLATCRVFLEHRGRSANRVFCLRYEDMFANNFEALRAIFDRIGLVYDDSIFRNEGKNNKSHIDIDMGTITSKPDEKEHGMFRTWQINQPFVYRDAIDKICLTREQLKRFTDSDEVQILYPDFTYPADGPGIVTEQKRLFGLRKKSRLLNFEKSKKTEREDMPVGWMLPDNRSGILALHGAPGLVCMRRFRLFCDQRVTQSYGPRPGTSKQQQTRGEPRDTINEHTHEKVQGILGHISAQRTQHANEGLAKQPSTGFGSR
eukprot:jgi/Mesvir1/4499/Mv03778-RA.1